MCSTLKDSIVTIKIDTNEKIVANKIKIWQRIERRIGLDKEQVTWQYIEKNEYYRIVYKCGTHLEVTS
jgi:2-hydroxy-3-keto-5-methylthiopentenyl-1-phosphate phosphatase